MLSHNRANGPKWSITKHYVTFTSVRQVAAAWAKSAVFDCISHEPFTDNSYYGSILKVVVVGAISTLSATCTEKYWMSRADRRRLEPGWLSGPRTLAAIVRISCGTSMKTASSDQRSMISLSRQKVSHAGDLSAILASVFKTYSLFSVAQRWLKTSNIRLWLKLSWQ